jgi:hypothetical protein
MMSINSPGKGHSIKLEISPPKFHIITQSNITASPRELYPLSAKNISSLSNERKAKLLQSTKAIKPKNASTSPSVRLKFQASINTKVSIGGQINMHSSSNNNTVAVEYKSSISPVML